MVIGHCLGAGLARVSAVDEKMKPRTIIIWHSDGLTNEAPYSRFGFTHFCVRPNLGAMILKMLGVSAPT